MLARVASSHLHCPVRPSRGPVGPATATAGSRCRPSPRTSGVAAAGGRADTVPVWETLLTLSSAPVDLTSSVEEQQQELVDTLWSLQYRTPGACCASAGKVVTTAPKGDPAAPMAAVFYRFSNQAQAERFIAGPQLADAKARLLGTANISLSMWKVLVPNDMDALFKRGPAFETGVDLVLKLRPAGAAGGAGSGDSGAAGEGGAAGGAAAAAAADAAPPPATQALVELVTRLQKEALAEGCVQVSCGYDQLSLDPQYVWMGRFPTESAAARFVSAAAMREVLLSGRGEGPEAALALSSLAMVEVGAVDGAKQRM